MDERLKRHRFGFLEICDRPTSDELKRHYAERYFQTPENSSYQVSYTSQEIERIEAHAELKRFAIAERFRGGSADFWMSAAAKGGCSASFAEQVGMLRAWISRVLECCRTTHHSSRGSR